jgi:nitroimidazol reductase NimA-like FMN-containing flavoprotein (pyridoxamine 5'-phosphate oxidase superfamily)
VHLACRKEISIRPEHVTEVMHDPLVQELLHSAIPARMAYNGTDGNSRVIPVGFLWKNEQIVVCTASNAYKVKALAANPKVALTIDTEAPYRALVVRGTASVEIVDGVPSEYLETSRKSLNDEQQFRAFEAEVRSLYKQMARISIAPEWAKVLDFEPRLPSAVEQLMSPDDSAGS